MAYNKSGEVVIGIVTELEIKPRKHRWNPFEYTIRVRMLGGDGAFSTVKNHLCIVSIQGE